MLTSPNAKNFSPGPYKWFRNDFGENVSRSYHQNIIYIIGSGIAHRYVNEFRLRKILINQVCQHE